MKSHQHSSAKSKRRTHHAASASKLKISSPFFASAYHNKKKRLTIILSSDGKSFIETHHVVKYKGKDAATWHRYEKQLTQDFFNKFLKSHFNGERLNKISKEVLRCLFRYKGEPSDLDKYNIRELVKMLRKELNA